MDLWQHWLAAIQYVLAFCAVDLHLGMGLAIILVTLVVRSLFLPVTWTIALRAESRRTGRFLWMADLARPDFWLAIAAGAATMALMATNPDLPEHVRLILIVVPALFTVITALKFSAALSLYWTTTNAFSGAQAIALRAVLRRRARTAALE